MFWFEFGVVLLLILLNGLLAMSEIALVSARKVRLRQMADEGNRAAATALEMAETPGRTLSAVQVGITLISILSGAFGGAALAGRIAPYLERVPVISSYADALALGLVVMVITYLSLVLGELAPKRIGLSNAERTAVRVAPGLNMMARVTGPVVRLLMVSTEGVLRVLGIRPQDDDAVTDEEIRVLMRQGADAGIFEPIEEEIVGQVFRLSDRKVTALLTPRMEITWLDINDPPDTLRDKLSATGHTRLPVADGTLDNVLGIVSTKDLMLQLLGGEQLDIRAALKPALFVPESMPALTVVERMRDSQAQMALVIDEFGGMLGLITGQDIVEEIIGDWPDAPQDHEEQEAIQRADGSWLLDGMFPIDEFQEMFSIKELPRDSEGYYETVGGFVMASLGRVPSVGDQFEWRNVRVEVVDMDGRRVDRVLVARSDAEPPQDPAALI